MPMATTACSIGRHDHARCRPVLPPRSRPGIIAARLEHRRGKDWLAGEVCVPARTISRVLRRHDLPRLCTLDPLTGELIRSSKMTAHRYERERPGELVHMDVKKIGRIPDGGGWRAHGREISRTTADKSARIGYDYVHSVVDDQSARSSSRISL
jgi:hypothetical protein